MTDKTSIATRMKRYEQVNTNYLLRRTPVIIRIDGKSFHTWTKQCEKPFDGKLHTAMCNTMHALCRNIQNAVYGYTQSDEISILLCDWTMLNTEQWFDGNIQKMASISASLATGYFNALEEVSQLNSKLAFFDARVFNIPREDVYNYFLWRQQDATRNSIQTYARVFYSHKQLHKKSCNEIQHMLFNELEVNWNDLETWQKRGSHTYKCLNEDNSSRWVTDEEMPLINKSFNDFGPINTYLKIG